jgi:sugar (pentulose or hexulose) kinase
VSIVGLDVGTTSVKAVEIDEDGAAKAKTKRR